MMAPKFLGVARLFVGVISPEILGTLPYLARQEFDFFQLCVIT